jgi:hypothetical protein
MRYRNKAIGFLKTACLTGIVAYACLHPDSIDRQINLRGDVSLLDEAPRIGALIKEAAKEAVSPFLSENALAAPVDNTSTIQQPQKRPATVTYLSTGGLLSQEP